MITENEIINDLSNLHKKLDLLANNRRNNYTFWKDASKSIEDILSSIKLNKRIYGW